MTIMTKAPIVAATQQANKASRIGSMMGNPTGATYSMPVAFDHIIMVDRPIDSPENWREEIALIRSAGPFDRVLIQINSGGGYLSTAAAFINAMAQCQAPITTEVVGDCCSAGTMIFLKGDEQIVNDSIGLFMVHQPSHGTGGIDNQIYDYAIHARKSNTQLMRDLYRGFLSEEEIEAAITGTEYWFTAEEVGERCEARMKMLRDEDPAKADTPTREAYEKMTKEEILDKYFGPKEKTEEEIALEVTRAMVIETNKFLQEKKVGELRKEYDVPKSIKGKQNMINWCMEALFDKYDWEALLAEAEEV